MGRSRSHGTANSNVIELFGKFKEPEHNLWTSVLAKAAHDAVYSSDYREASTAISWFESGCKDFRLVCHLAGRNHQYVYYKIKEKISKRKQEIKERKTNVKKQMEIDLEAKKKKQYHKAYAKIWNSENRKHLKEYQEKYHSRHKGGYHSGKKWGRKWSTGTHTDT
tara:strand:- start:169 stop:663 length:495 start_codon:yes stop_codon:yes gene_type:complete